MIFAPPGSAKSTYTTELFSAWAMVREGTQIIGASHTVDLAQDFSRKIQRRITANADLLGYGLATENKGRWHTTNRGAYLAAGAGSSIPGFRADIAIIDDAIRGRQGADSDALRKSIWDWYLGDLERRLRVGGAVVLMQTRWHEDDLPGRLLASESHRWRVIKLPALAEEADDPLGRAIGEPLWADDAYGYGATLTEIRENLEQNGATREWASQFQQRPRPSDGALFKTAFLGKPLDVDPTYVAQVRAWDLAATAQTGTRDPDWTVGLKLGRTADAKYVISDVVRFRGGPSDVVAGIKATAARDGKGVTVSLPQDPGQAGKAQVQYLVGELSGFTVRTSPETGDKATRAGPVASQCNVGNLLMVFGGWNRSLIDEMAAFPAGAKDDQVDALSRAFGHLALAPRVPMVGAIIAMTPRVMTP